MKNILVVTLSNIGDVILTTPVITNLAVLYPQARLTVVVGPRARPVLEGSRETHRERVSVAIEGWRLTFDGRFKHIERDDAPPLRFDLQQDPWECENLVL